MNSEPVRYSRLIMQLMVPTPMNALRRARSASPSSERRTPGTAAIYRDLFERGVRPQIQLGTQYLILAIFAISVQRSRINLNGHGRRALAAGDRSICGQRLIDRRGGGRKRHPYHRHRDAAYLAMPVEQGSARAAGGRHRVRARPGYGSKPVAPLAAENSQGKTIYLVGPPEQARARRAAALDRGRGSPRGRRNLIASDRLYSHLPPSHGVIMIRRLLGIATLTAALA